MIPLRFDEMGYGSLNIIQNLGAFFVFFLFYLIVLLLAMVAYLIMNPCMEPFGYTRFLCLKYRQRIFWNFWIRMLIEVYLELTVTFFVNLKYIETSTFSDILNLLVLLFSGALVILFPIVTFLYNYFLGHYSHHRSQRIKFGAMQEGINWYSIWSR